MKHHQTYKILFLTGLTLVFNAANADQNAAPLVQTEYTKQQTQFEMQLAKTKKTLKELEILKQKAIQDSKNLSTTDSAGLKAMKRYDTLMSSRYATEQGEFQGWRQLASQDVDNINHIFDSYMHAKPLSGRVSAGQAHRLLDWGMGRLEELSKIHNSPNAENNSDLEIVSHQIKEAETTVKSVLSAADRLGLKINSNASTEDVIPDPPHERLPSSQKNESEATDLSTP